MLHAVFSLPLFRNQYVTFIALYISKWINNYKIESSNAKKENRWIIIIIIMKCVWLVVCDPGSDQRRNVETYTIIIFQ